MRSLHLRPLRQSLNSLISLDATDRATTHTHTNLPPISTKLRTVWNQPSLLFPNQGAAPSTHSRFADRLGARARARSDQVGRPLELLVHRRRVDGAPVSVGAGCGLVRVVVWEAEADPGGEQLLPLVAHRDVRIHLLHPGARRARRAKTGRCGSVGSCDALC